MESFRPAGLQNSTILCCRNQPKTHRPLLTVRQCQIAMERIQTKAKQQISFCTSINVSYVFWYFPILIVSKSYEKDPIKLNHSETQFLLQVVKHGISWITHVLHWNFHLLSRLPPSQKPANWVAIMCFEIVVISCLFQSWVESFGATRITCNIENMAGMVFMRCLWRPRYTSCGKWLPYLQMGIRVEGSTSRLALTCFRWDRTHLG